MEECHKLLTDQVDDAILRYNVSKPLPLGGPQGQLTIQSDFFFNKDLEYLRYGSKGSKPALSISKMKAAYYPDVGLEQMVPDQMWIEEECKYGVTAMYVFSLYGYDYMKTIVLRRDDLQEHIIAERDFKNMYLSDFKDLYLLNLRGYLNHLPPKDKKILEDKEWMAEIITLGTKQNGRLRLLMYTVLVTKDVERSRSKYGDSDGCPEHYDELLTDTGKSVQGDFLLKMNLLNHWSVLTVRRFTKDGDGVTCSSGVQFNNPIITLNVTNQRHHDK
ncbi:hypothetical protein Tco_1164736 [Tanacetum coccineum]